MSMEFLELFNYLKNETPLHKFDPRSKLVLLIVYFALSLIFKSLFLMVLLLLSVIPLIIIAKLGKNIALGLKNLKFIIIFILIVNSWLFTLNSALIIAIRLTTLMIVFSVFFQTTQPEELVQVFVKFKIPYHLAFSFSLAFRFIPTMAEETNLIKDAQKSRGFVTEKKSGIISQAKGFFPLLIPLISNSIRRAFHVAEALETRAFGYSKVPNFYYKIKLTLKDWGMMLGYITLLVFSIYLHNNLLLFPDIFSYSLSI